MKYLYLLLLLCTTALTAQTLTGHVYSAVDGKPLEAATVYLDGTTISTSTNAEGYFRLSPPQQYNASLVVNYMGYDSFRLDEPYKAGSPLKINLVPNTISLDEVEVTPGPKAFTRAQMLRAFRALFLGTSAAGKSCKILNEDDIRLYYDVNANTLIASADKPLVIRNKRLQYEVSYDLMLFETQYKVKSLDPNYMLGSVFAGTTFFRDVSKNNNADKKRKETYKGSVPHLMKTIADNSWEKSGFRLYLGSFPTAPAATLRVTDTLSQKKVILTKDAKDKLDAEPTLRTGQPRYRLNLLDGERRNSFFYFSRDEFYIDANGMFSPIEALLFGGYLGSLKAGDMLPADYVYKE